MKILDNLGQDYEVIDYINTPPSQEQLQSLADMMGIAAKDFIRSKDAIFKKLKLESHLDDDAILFKHMSENPRLIERPIIVKGDKAVLGRPPEKIHDFINS